MMNLQTSIGFQQCVCENNTNNLPLQNADNGTADSSTDNVACVIGTSEVDDSDET